VASVGSLASGLCVSCSVSRVVLRLRDEGLAGRASSSTSSVHVNLLSSTPLGVHALLIGHVVPPLGLPPGGLSGAGADHRAAEEAPASPNRGPESWAAGGRPDRRAEPGPEEGAEGRRVDRALGDAAAGGNPDLLAYLETQACFSSKTQSNRSSATNRRPSVALIRSVPAVDRWRSHQGTWSSRIPTPGVPESQPPIASSWLMSIAAAFVTLGMRYLPAIPPGPAPGSLGVGCSGPPGGPPVIGRYGLFLGRLGSIARLRGIGRPYSARDLSLPFNHPRCFWRDHGRLAVGRTAPHWRGH
jgi:hypothetical protein